MNAAPAPNHVFDVDPQNFETRVLQASATTPVLVDFWASWCEPCKTLGPMLEKLAAEYNGAFVLARVDAEAVPELTSMFGIRSIPTVMLVKNGEIADGFSGALPESQVREFLARHLTPLDAAPVEEAMPEAPESPEQALTRIQAAIAAAPEKAELKLDLALALMRSGQAKAAQTELDGFPVNLATDARARRLRSQLELANALTDAPSQSELKKRVEENPQDWAAQDLLGVRLLLEDDATAGLDQFLMILEKAREWNDGAAKKRLLAAFATLDDPELVSRYRRRMASLVF